jgi:hypothetical protein
MVGLVSCVQDIVIGVHLVQLLEVSSRVQEDLDLVQQSQAGSSREILVLRAFAIGRQQTEVAQGKVELMRWVDHL